MGEEIVKLYGNIKIMRVFYFDELTAATVTPQVNYTEINAGWSL